MKRFATVIGAVAILLASQPLYAACPDPCTGSAGTAYAWDGTGPSSTWEADGPWDSSGYPGDTDGVIDSATIGDSNEDSLTQTVDLGESLAECVSTVTVDADAEDLPMTLNINADGCLKTTGLVTVKGKQSGRVGKTATLKVVPDYGLQPYKMELYGREDADKSHAVFEVYGDVTVQGDAGTDTTFQGYCDVMLDTDVTFTAKDVELEAGAVVTVSPTTADGGTLQATKVTVNNATLRVTDATISTQ